MKKQLRNGLIVLFTFTTSAVAATGSGSGEGSFLLALFIGFFSLILVFQVVPAVLLFAGMIKGLRGHTAEETTRSHG